MPRRRGQEGKGGRAPEGGPLRAGRPVKTRRRLLTWYFEDVPGATITNRLYVETEVIYADVLGTVGMSKPQGATSEGVQQAGVEGGVRPPTHGAQVPMWVEHLDAAVRAGRAEAAPEASLVHGELPLAFPEEVVWTDEEDPKP